MQALKLDKPSINEDAVRQYWQSRQDRTKAIVFGAYGSPYTRKLMAALRYQQVPFVYIARGSNADVGFPTPSGPPLLPNIVFTKDWVPMADSTFILREVERRKLHDEARSLVHPDPVVNLLAMLLEDFADEWMTKPMFHYRWYYARDAAKASMLLPCWANEAFLAGPEDELKEAAQTISKRQIDRLGVVGSSPKTKDIIEDSYVQFLRCFNAHLAAGYAFLLGDRPCGADFAIYGHLNQLAFIDPTSMAVCETTAPRVFAWIGMMEDLSGIPVSKEGWKVQRDRLPPTLVALLERVVAPFYVPYMIANARAWDAREKEVCFDDHQGREWTSTPFKYQQKCVVWLQEAFSKLGSVDQEAFTRLMSQTKGCLDIFTVYRPRL